MNYRVAISVPYVYDIEAEDENEAKEIALGRFFEDSTELTSQIPEVKVKIRGE